MCGCTKSKKTITPLSALKPLGKLLEEGIMAEYIYNGPHATTTRRGEATNVRYTVVRNKCVPLAVADYELFRKRNENEFTPCVKVDDNHAMLSGIVESGETIETSFVAPEGETVSVVLPEVTKSEAVPSATTAKPEVQTISSIVDITTLTVANALPIIREAVTNIVIHTIDVKVGQVIGFIVCI